MISVQWHNGRDAFMKVGVDKLSLPRLLHALVKDGGATTDCTDSATQSVHVLAVGFG